MKTLAGPPDRIIALGFFDKILNLFNDRIKELPLVYSYLILL